MFAVLTAAVALALSGPPSAYVEPGHVPLALDGWCWGRHCSAPIAASTRPAVVRRGSTVRVELRFVPRTVRLFVGGRTASVARSGRELSFRARQSGGLTLNVSGARGWVIYVGRLVLR